MFSFKIVLLYCLFSYLFEYSTIHQSDSFALVLEGDEQTALALLSAIQEAAVA